MPFNIYPSRPLWLKRIGHTILLCGISFNLWLGDLQRQMLAHAQVITETIAPVLPSARVAVSTMDQTMIAGLQTLEGSRFAWIGEKISLPKSTEVQDKTAAFYRFEKACKDYAATLSITGRLLKWSSILMWVPILTALIWMIKDVQHTRYRIVPLLCLLIAITINLMLHHYLQTHWPL